MLYMQTKRAAHLVAKVGHFWYEIVIETKIWHIFIGSFFPMLGCVNSRDSANPNKTALIILRLLGPC